MATSTAIFAGRGFSGLQDLMRGVPGVLSTRVAYPEADDDNPDDDRDTTEQAVAVEVTYDSERTDHHTLLDFFFQAQDPTASREPGGPSKLVLGADRDGSGHTESRSHG